MDKVRGFVPLFGCILWHAQLPQPGIEPLPSAVEVWSLNNWTPREIQIYFLLEYNCFTVLC